MSLRRGEHQDKKPTPKLSEKSSSFYTRGGRTAPTSSEVLPRPRTVPNLLIGTEYGGISAASPPKQRKLLLNVTVQRSLGAIRVVLPTESTVEDLITAALLQYAKEARVPALLPGGASGFRLHYSQFSLESLDKEAKLMTLGSRNFFMCPAPQPVANGVGAALAPAMDIQFGFADVLL